MGRVKMPSGKKQAKAKVTSKDIPGIGRRGGAARQAGRKIEQVKKTRKSRLDSIMKQINFQQGTDQHQGN